MTASRKLPISDYFRILQLEYFSYKMRELIYDEPLFSKMNGEIAKKKKIKIQDLAKKIGIISIFDSQNVYDTFLEKEFLQEFGFPNIQYGIDEEKKRAVAYWDRVSLFKEGVIVSYKGKPHKVLNNDPYFNQILVEDLENNQELFLSYVCVKLDYLRSLLHAVIRE